MNRIFFKLPVVLSFCLLCFSAVTLAEVRHIIDEPNTDVYSVASGDIDGDGDIDLVMGQSYYWAVPWYKNDGFQRFTLHLLPLGDGNLPYTVEIADMEDDGDLDIVATVSNGVSRRHYIYWFENEDFGSFILHLITHRQVNFTDIVPINVDLDPMKEIVFNCQTNLGYYDYSNGQWVCETFYIGDVNNMSVQDVDNDADQDVLYATNGPAIIYMRNSGYGNFTPQVVMEDTVVTTDIHAVQLNDDSDWEYVSAIYEYVNFFERDEEGDFCYRFHFAEPEVVIRLEVAEYNGDGYSDVLALTGHSVVLYQSYVESELTFTRTVLDSTADPCMDIGFQDMDGDGDLDIHAVVDGSKIVWYENPGALPILLKATVENYPPYAPNPGMQLGWQLSVTSSGDYWNGDICYGLRDEEGNEADEVVELDFDGVDADATVTMDIEYEIAGEILSGRYVLQVWAEDDNGNVIDQDEFPVLIGPVPPAAFRLTYPADGAFADSTVNQFIWNPSVDEEQGDSLRYDVWMGNQPDLSDAVCVDEGLANTVCGFPPLEENRIYYWCVHATDSNTEGRWADDTLCFTTIPPNPPWHFALIEPENGFDISDEATLPLTFSWHEAEDNDFLDTVRYTISIMADTASVPFLVQETGEEEWAQIDCFEPGGAYRWWVTAIDRFGLNTQSTDTFLVTSSLGIETAVQAELPQDFAISRAYPNPFNPTLTLEIALPTQAFLDVSVYNILGEKVTILGSREYVAGYHTLLWHATGSASGIYFVKATISGEKSAFCKVLLVK